MEYQWLLFCPQLPATPSSPRVMVWRRMRSAGSISLDNGIWVLPCSPAHEQFIREMQTYVQNQGGSCRIFLANALDSATQDEILNQFRLDRDQEYFEVKEQCQDFLAEIDKEINRQNYSFAEYEENEQDLNKLEAWLEKVRQRDFIGGSQASETAALLEQCRQALHRFAAEVFNHEGGNSSQNQTGEST